MKTAIFTIFLLLMTKNGLCQEVASSYTFFSNNQIFNPEDPDRILTTDTIHVQNNGTVVFVGDLKAITNAKYAYIVMNIRKNNFNPEFNGKMSEFFVDYEQGKLYDLEAKEYYNYKPVELNIGNKDDDSLYNLIYKEGQKQATLIFDKTLPKELSAKFFIKNNMHGLRKVITPNAVFTLSSFQTKPTDLNLIFEKFKRECVESDKSQSNIF